MGALLDDASVVDDEDLVGATYASAMIEHDLVMQMLKRMLNPKWEDKLANYWKASYMKTLLFR